MMLCWTKTEESSKGQGRAVFLLCFNGLRKLFKCVEAFPVPRPCGGSWWGLPDSPPVTSLHCLEMGSPMLVSYILFCSPSEIAF